MSHELFHGLTAMVVGGNWERFSVWAVQTSLPDGIADPLWREGLIKGLAAPLNILLAVACAILLRCRLSSSVHMVLFYIAAYCGFLGFGYLFIDPLFANEESAGDWARVTMLLGGHWWVRFPIIACGIAGTIFGYFWVGSAANRMLAHPTESRRDRIRNGFLICVMPYIANNLIFSVLALQHPLGAKGFFISLSQYWLGYCGLVWAFLIKFVWSLPDSAPDRESLVPQTVQAPMVIMATMIYIAIVVCL
ncbi:MAG: hypothetical protein AB8B91_21660 [Rubripirellula sp.]